MSNSSIWPFQVLTLRARVDLGAIAINRYSIFPKALALLEPLPKMQFSVICRTFIGFTPLQWRSRCILRAHWLGEFYSSAEMQSVHSTSPVDKATELSLGGVLPLCRDAHSLQPPPTGPQDTLWGSINPLRRRSKCVLQPQPTWMWLVWFTYLTTCKFLIRNLMLKFHSFVNIWLQSLQFIFSNFHRNYFF